MTLHELAGRFHRLGHKHYEISKDGIGIFQCCEQRWPWGRVHIAFKPDFSEARWWAVPAVEYSEDETLLERMLHTDSAHHAMAVLRAEYAEMHGCP